MSRQAGGSEKTMTKTKINLQTISRSIQLLRCFDDELELGISELAQRLGLAKSTVYGIVSTLEIHNFLEQDSRTGRYRLGTEIFRLGTKVKSDLLNLTKPYMEKLVTDYCETVHLVVPDQCSILYIHKIESPHSMRICSRVGERLPLYCTAVGKAILAQMDEKGQAAVICATSFHPYTPYTIRDRSVLLQELVKVKADGFAVDREELEIGLTCVAAPVFDGNGKPGAAISVAGPTVRMTNLTIEKIAQGLLGVTREISARIGYLPS